MFLDDLRFGARTLRNNPVFAMTAVLTIALGIGTSTAIFSVVDAVLLRPLPYAHPDRLALIQTDMRARHVLNFPIAPGDMPELRQRVTALESVGAIAAGPGTFVGTDGKPEQITTAGVTANFFSLLGTHIAFGRNFAESDGTPPPPPPANGQQQAAPNPANQPALMTILSHGFWERRFAGDSSVIGATVQIGGAPSTIVGVAAPDPRVVFPTGTGTAGEPDTYSVFRIDWSTASRINVFLRVIGRLAPGASFAAAQAQIDNLGADLQSRFPVYKTANFVWRVEPMHAGIVKDVRPMILALMGAVLFVLLIACANVANLLLVRALTRERELAVRAALGGTRMTLVRQMFAESVLLAACGAAAGLLLAKLGITLLLGIAPASLPRVDDVGIDPTVLTFAVVAAFVSALVFGVLPALRASRPNLAQTLRAGGRSPSLGGGKYLRQSVVLLEVALSFVLLIGSGLMLRSFMALERVDPGFDPTGVLTFTAFNPRPQGARAREAYTQTLEERLRAIPGVTAVTGASPLPLDGQDFNMRWGTPDAASDPSLFQQATIYFVLPGYFAAMKAKLLAGRAFTAADNDTASTSIIIDDLLAAKAFPGQSPQSIVGKQLFCRITTPEAQMYQIIGVAQHERHLTLAAPGREGVFATDGLGGFGGRRWAVRTTGDPAQLIPAVRKAVADIDPMVPVGDLMPMSAYVDRAMAPTRFSLTMIAIFAMVAVVLASVGLYGVLATTVRQRTAEIGVRMAFGATSGSIFRLIVGQGLALSAAGIVAGGAVSLALTGVLDKAGMLVSIKPTDPVTYLGISALFVLIAAAACWIPAWRAARLAPNVALRSD